MKSTDLNSLFVLRKGEGRKKKGPGVGFFFFPVLSLSTCQFHLKQGMHEALQSEFCFPVFFIFV